MKRTSTLLIGALLIVLGACKREQEVLPKNDQDLDAANQQGLATTAVATPQLVAGKKNEPGFANGTGSAARFNWPAELFVDGDGSLYVCDYENLAIRKISIQNKVTTLNIDPEIFGGVMVNDGPQTVAVLNNGTVGIQSPGHILLYRNGAVFKDMEHYNDFGYGDFGGIDESPDGSSFYFITNYVNVPNEVENSKLGVIKNDAYYGTPKVISNTRTANFPDTRSNVVKYVVIYAQLYKLTSTGSTLAFPNLSFPNGITSVAVNKAGTDVYVVYDRTIQRIRNNKLTTILTGAGAMGIALANSEKYLYYTSIDNTVNRILLPQ